MYAISLGFPRPWTMQTSLRKIMARIMSPMKGSDVTKLESVSSGNYITKMRNCAENSKYSTKNSMKG